MEIEVSLDDHEEASFDRIIASINRELSRSRLSCVDLRRNRYDVLSTLTTLESEFKESLKVMKDRTTDDSSIMSKQLVTEEAQDPEQIFVDLNYEAATNSSAQRHLYLRS